MSNYLFLRKQQKKKVKFLISIEIVIEGELLRKENKLVTTISSFLSKE